MKMQDIPQIKNLADLVGDFIRYWGFRKIHGEIWTVVYLANKPLSGVEIVRLLHVSKALVSPALKELEAEGLIEQAASENSKTKRYQAVEDVSRIIQGVLNRREKPMLTRIKTRYTELSQAPSRSQLNSIRLQKLGLMIEQAQLTLNMITSEDLLWD